MLDSKLLDYIILALIFAIAINMFLQVFGDPCKSGKESMSATNAGQPVVKESPFKQVVPLETLLIGAPIDDTSSTPYKFLPKVPVTNDQPVEFEQKVQQKSEEAVNKIVQLQEQNKIANKLCPLKGTPYENDRYIREFVLEGKYNCVDNPEKNNFTRAEIIDYQNNMLDFNDKINGSSSNGVDVVDKLNELYTGRNTSTTGYQGQTIASVYNGLTQSIIDKKKKCVNPNCLLPPKIDNGTKTALYSDSAQFGKYLKHGLMYEDDNVNNGSKFYNGIEATDSEFEPNLMWE
jgi:hypothetical protein